MRIGATFNSSPENYNREDTGGFHEDSRASHIPAMLEMLKIPYTGSRVLTLSIALNKAKTKEILSYHKIPTPKFQLFKSLDEPLNKNLDGKIKKIALRIFNTLGCLDFCRIDIRLDKNNVPNVMEINPIPCLIPDNSEESSNFPKSCFVTGMSYNENDIKNSRSRYRKSQK